MQLADPLYRHSKEALMNKSLLFEVVASDLAKARDSVKAAAHLEFAEHESEYYGIYFRGILEGARLRLQENFMEDDGECTEAGFPDSRFLLYVDGAGVDVDRALSRLGDFRVLREGRC